SEAKPFSRDSSGTIDQSEVISAQPPYSISGRPSLVVRISNSLPENKRTTPSAARKAQRVLILNTASRYSTPTAENAKSVTGKIAPRRTLDLIVSGMKLLQAPNRRLKL